MTLLSVVATSLALLFASGVASLLLYRSPRFATAVASAGAVIGCVMGLAASVYALVSGAPEEIVRAAWHLPVGEFHVGVDALSIFFLLCIYVVSGLSALYAVGYMGSYRERNLALPAFFFNLLIVSMIVVVVARDAVLFLMAWEIMTMASYFLVTFEDQRDEVRRAGFTYLIASHVSVVFVFVLFAFLSHETGGASFDFGGFAQHQSWPHAVGATALVLALIGFGTKAGFWPMHIWLPDAHPAAPSHVSALMSGVMIKMGIYGILRTLTFLGPPPIWWGGLVVAIGAVSGIIGVIYALAQHDLKRLLAYHSIENIGIIALGIGVGLIGQAFRNPALAFAGYAGALLHVLNHGLFKGLLFHCAGSVLHATGTRDIDKLGGLYRHMKLTGTTFLIGAVAICGLPPLNGFVSEWLIYYGAFRSGFTLSGAGAIAAVVALTALSLIGGLAVACFVKVFGVVFLGAPRSPEAEHAHGAPLSMRLATVAGAAACIAIGFWPQGAVRIVAEPAKLLVGQEATAGDLATAVGPIALVAAILAGLTLTLALLRWSLLRGREIRTTPTWGCGYPATTPRMQYTAASFASPLLEPFAMLLRRRVHQDGPSGYFPSHAHHDLHYDDLAGERILLPLTRKIVAALGRMRIIQHGHINIYLAYILLTFVVLLAWQLARLRG